MITQKQIQEMQKNRFAKLDQIQKQCVFDVDDNCWHLHCADEGWLHDVMQRIYPPRTEHIAFFIKSAEVHLRSALQIEPLANMDWLWIDMLKAFPIPEDNEVLLSWQRHHGGAGHLPTDINNYKTISSWLQKGIRTHYAVVIVKILKEMYHPTDPNGFRCDPPY